ncbi:MAG: EAL domain-containing protein [Agathobacter sp.]|nr:EAL domain-containing protein [Agathobacter sp.]MBQ2282775.1 EAL domain-containing protein [Agathobacter sp.]
MKKKRIACNVRNWLFLFVSVLVFASALMQVQAEPAQQEEQGTSRKVKVAFFPMDGFHIEESNGTYAGMDVEYLDEVCVYTQWDVEYVKCDSWDKALKMLQEQKVDLVGSAQYSEERAQIYQYADLPSGYTFGTIFTKGDSTVAYEDFEAMQNIEFGMVSSYVRKDEFMEYMADNGITDPQITYYESTADLQEALENGEVEAIVHTFTEIKEGQRMLGRFAPRPFYYITYSGNDELMRELNQAIADITISHPELESELIAKYYESRLDQTVVFSNQEKDYIQSKGEVVVGYLDNQYPFSYEEDGELKGLARQSLEELFEITGLKYSFQKIESYKEGKQALAEGSIDILSYCPESDETVEKENLLEVTDYASVPLALVMKKGNNQKEISTLAVVSYLSEEAEEILSLEKSQLLVLENLEDCMKAVQDGSANAAICDGYLAEYLIDYNFSFRSLEIQGVLGNEYEISMAVKADENSALYGIMSKALDQVSAKDISEYILQDNTYSRMRIDLFLQDNSLVIMGIMIAIILIIILVAVHMISDSRRIQRLMYKDSELNLWNLNYLIYWGSKKLLADKKSAYVLGYLNLSNFRRYNTVYGWHAGQKLLESVVDVLGQHVQSKAEICARSQGDHFILLLQYTDQESALDRFRIIEEAIEDRIIKDTDNHMTINMGVYFIPEDTADLQNALSYAMQAMDFVRGGHSSSIQLYDESLENAIKDKMEREQILEAADIHKDFVAYYQPKVDIRSEKIIGAEALVRFMDPTANGAIRSPAFFVPYYEETGQIKEVDFFVLESVCKLLHRRLSQGQSVVPISCNFSRSHFATNGFTYRFLDILEKYQVPKDLIEVEITETLVVEEMEQMIVKETIDELRDKGIRLSIDDFGSGYSSLGVFEQIPASVIKLDRSFLLNKESRERQVKIMRNIVHLAGELDAQIVCEGVETDKDIELMTEIGAYVAQGYRYYKPIPEAAFEEALSKQ